jgi:hypothetical protein
MGLGLNHGACQYLAVLVVVKYKCNASLLRSMYAYAKAGRRVRDHHLASRYGQFNFPSDSSQHLRLAPFTHQYQYFVSFSSIAH